LTLAKTSFEKIYRDEVNVNTKERMLLVLNIVYQGKISAHVATDLIEKEYGLCLVKKI
jgi:hypothetical protein